MFVCDTEVKSVDKDNKQRNICECSASVYMHASVCVCLCVSPLVLRGRVAEKMNS